MNKNKLSNPVRLIAFFLTTLVLICTFGFTVDGWQIDGSIIDGDDIGMFPTTSDKENEEDTTVNNTPDEPDIYIPEFVDRITGLEVSEEISKNAHLSFVMNPNLPSYGISSADLLCEVSTENGSRYIAFINDTQNLWKIGSLTQTRGYISNISKYFGAISVSSGNDDSIYYTGCDTKGSSIDLTLGGYHYTEYTNNIYTNRDLLDKAILSSGINRSNIILGALPYDFAEFGTEYIMPEGKTANKVTVTRGKDSSGELVYNAEEKHYTLYKNGQLLTDSLNGKTAYFTNCFVLFADSITYDNANCSQMVMDTLGQGSGFYFTEGKAIEIFWIGTEEGTLNFYTSDGERLTANRGKSYISFIKSSITDSLLFQ